MSTLEAIVNITITSAGRGVSRKGFGIPLVIAKHSHFGPLFKEYNLATALSDMVADGFSAYEPAYRAVNAIARNTPKPLKVIVGKLLTDFDHEFDIAVKTVTALGGEVYAFDIVSPDGSVTSISYTASPADTQDIIAAALQSQINAITNLTASVATNTVSAAADNSNDMFYVVGLDEKILDFEDTTIDSNLATELGNIAAQNGDWYGLVCADPQSAARITALANYIETQERIFFATTHDTACGDAVSTTDIAYTLNAAQLFRTALIYSGYQGYHAGATWLGEGFPYSPGAQTWAYKPLSGIVFDDLQSGFMTALDGKKCNYYIEIAGLPCTNGGEATGGTMASGEYIDAIRGRDWLVARMRERIFGLLVNVRKVPYTQGGIDQVTTQVEAQLNEGITATYLSGDVPEGQDKPYIVTAPGIFDISQANKIARLLPDVYFEAGLAGAIHATRINGVIQV